MTPRGPYDLGAGEEVGNALLFAAALGADDTQRQVSLAAPSGHTSGLQLPVNGGHMNPHNAALPQGQQQQPNQHIMALQILSLEGRLYEETRRAEAAELRATLAEAKVCARAHLLTCLSRHVYL